MSGAGSEQQSISPTENVVAQSAEPIEHIEADPNISDTDSAYAETDPSIQSASLSSSVLNYKYENGRRYHAFREGSYVLPNDEDEQDRLDLHHHVFRLCLGGQLFRAPLENDNARVLDIGTGTGIWAISFADDFPASEVSGIDLSPIQPLWVPPNAKFYVDDVESEWVYSDSEAFDFIHARAMGGSIGDWKKLYSQIMRHLKPGGWVEIQEYEALLKSDDYPTLDHAPNFKRWQDLINEASVVFGKNLNVAAEQKQHLIDAGFVNVQDDVYKVPVGTWPRDRKLKELGKFQQVQACAAIEPFTLGFLGKVMKWSEQECKEFAEKVVDELSDRNKHLYIQFHYVYGQKPATL